MKCKHNYVWSNYCGCYVCTECGQHAHKTEGGFSPLSQCFCGWSEYGRRPELDDVEDW